MGVAETRDAVHGRIVRKDVERKSQVSHPPSHAQATPRYSVVIPAFNEEASIDSCLDSLAAQDFDGPVEWVVVDNNSTDRTGAIARARGAVVVHEACPGVIWARQAGLAAATGAYIITTDADTTFPPNWLGAIDSACRAHPDAMLVAGPCEYVDGPVWGPWVTRLLFGAVTSLHRRTGRVLYVTATNLCFRRDRFDGYNTGLTQGGDELAVLRSQRGKGLVVWLGDNATLTSSRRLERGLVYNAVVSFGYYYILGYFLNHWTGRRIMGMAPAIRRRAGQAQHGTAIDAATGAGVVGALAGVVAVRQRWRSRR